MMRAAVRAICERYILICERLLARTISLPYTSVMRCQCERRKDSIARAPQGPVTGQDIKLDQSGMSSVGISSEMVAARLDQRMAADRVGVGYYRIYLLPLRTYAALAGCYLCTHVRALVMLTSAMPCCRRRVSAM